MKIKVKDYFFLVLITVLPLGMTSCIKSALPEINVDITNVTPSVEGSGIVKTTIQENGVTLYADMGKVNLKNLPVQVTVSSGATYEYVDVRFDTTYVDYPAYGIYHYPVVDTTITEHAADYTDFTQTRYIKVSAEAEGLREKDKATRAAFSKFGNIDPVTGKLFKIWAIQVLPAGFPSHLSFDNWYTPAACAYEHPYEMASNTPSYVWASTNNSMALMVTSDPTMCYGARSAAGYQGKALVLTSNDIFRFTQSSAKAAMAGCCFIGEFDGNDNNALTCTHVGLPFNQKPKNLKFYYKFLPKNLVNDASKLDKGFIKAVLYRTDSQVSYLTGKTIRDNSYANTVAYAEFYPDSEQADWKQMTIPFTYTQDVSAADVADYKYNLAIYFASSAEGFNFICGPGTELYIDEMDIECE